jgi:predicted RNA-binding Zn ribbon-like protein
MMVAVTSPVNELPGRLDLVRELVNSVDLETGEDDLATPEGLARWCRDRKLVGAREPLGEGHRKKMVEVREALRELLRANAGEAFDEGAGARLARAGRAARLAVRFGSDGRTTLEPAADGIEGAIAHIFAVVYTAQASGDWDRLKVCGEDTCQWAFYDHSKNRSRTWCSMAVCGNRAKTRTFRRRRAPSA